MHAHLMAQDGTRAAMPPVPRHHAESLAGCSSNSISPPLVSRTSASAQRPLPTNATSCSFHVPERPSRAWSPVRRDRGQRPRQDTNESRTAIPGFYRVPGHNAAAEGVKRKHQEGGFECLKLG
jgi:hypothetical protein